MALIKRLVLTARSSQIKPGKAVIWLMVAIATAMAISQFHIQALFMPLQALVFQAEDSYQHWMGQQSIHHPFLLIPIAFFGGLIASVSPCVLAMLPVNLTYIGTRDIRSRREAALNASAFVLGVITTLSGLGLFSALAGAVLVQFQGYISVIVGTVMVLMGLSLLGILSFSLPRSHLNLPIAGPYGFGLTFALVSSPCTSPVLLAILAAAGATGSQLMSILTMISYAVGHTAIIFCASVFTGLVKQARSLLPYSTTILRAGGAVLLVLGTLYLINGIRWCRLVFFP
jgi:cytochrome c-type biogenesis protein